MENIEHRESRRSNLNGSSCVWSDGSSGNWSSHSRDSGMVALLGVTHAHALNAIFSLKLPPYFVLFCNFIVCDMEKWWKWEDNNYCNCGFVHQPWSTWSTTFLALGAMQGRIAGGVLVKHVLLTCMCAYVLDVVALAVGEIGALVAGVQLAGKVIAQMFPPVVLANGGVCTQSALEHPEGADRTTPISISSPRRCSRWKKSCLYCWCCNNLCWPHLPKHKLTQKSSFVIWLIKMNTLEVKPKGNFGFTSIPIRLMWAGWASVTVGPLSCFQLWAQLLSEKASKS